MCSRNPDTLQLVQHVMIEMLGATPRACVGADPIEQVGGDESICTRPVKATRGRDAHLVDKTAESITFTAWKYAPSQQQSAESANGLPIEKLACLVFVKSAIKSRVVANDRRRPDKSCKLTHGCKRSRRAAQHRCGYTGNLGNLGGHAKAWIDECKKFIACVTIHDFAG